MNPTTVRLKIWIVLMPLSLFGLLLAAGCVKQSTPAPAASVPAPSPELATSFVGNEACKSCHPAEHKTHAASYHAKTLHLPTRQDLGVTMPPMGRVAGTDIVLSEQQGTLQLTIANESDPPLPFDFVFGSGKTGMTYVAFMGKQAMELHKSYFPSRHEWYLTPGHEDQRPTDVGMLYDPSRTKRCLLCHAVTLPENSYKPEQRFFGVGCESCHGAGGAHVAAMQSGDKTNLHMERLGQVDATRLINVCGRCHRGAQDVNMQSDQAKMTNRFQAYGLMKSRCFLESGNKLSCITCHDPHTNLNTDMKSYEAVCLNCHAGRATATASTGAAPPSTGKVCPVNPKSGCIPCHMPERPVFFKTNLPTRMADHYIQVIRKKPTS